MPVNKEGTFVIDRREMLRIKLKSLVAEVRIIQQEEKRMPSLLRLEMQVHRKTVIRDASRDTHLALGFLRGRSYSQLEMIHYTEPNWKKVEAMIFNYGALSYNADSQKVIALLVKYWREHPTWKAPSLVEIRKDYLAVTKEECSLEKQKTRRAQGLSPYPETTQLWQLVFDHALAA